MKYKFRSLLLICFQNGNYYNIMICTPALRHARFYLNVEQLHI